MDHRIVFPDALAAMTADALLGRQGLEHAVNHACADEQPDAGPDTDDDWAGGWYARSRRLLNDALRAATAADSSTAAQSAGPKAC